MPCDKKLRCKHPCIGFCGEPCPPVCRVCEPENEIFGNENKPNAMFIYLEKCKHIIESDSMDQWMQQSSEEINVKSCPKCKTTITNTSLF